MKPLTHLLLASLCALSVTACQAHPLVDLSIVDRDTGATLPTYGHHGRSYVPGEPGHHYALHLYNHTGERVMVVLSVDGVNAVTGQTAGTDQAGYVLGPWEAADIDGWRKSDYDVAQFVFTALDDSYAARTGRPDNVGVVGMAVFRERVREPVYVPQPYSPPVSTEDKDGNQPYDRREAMRDAAPPPPAAAAPIGGAMAAQAARGAPMAKSADRLDSASGAVAQQIGTGHGDREYSPIAQTTFERMSSSPQQVTQIWYDTPQQLAARGIMPRWYPRYPRENPQQAFPVGYVPDPPARW